MNYPPPSFLAQRCGRRLTAVDHPIPDPRTAPSAPIVQCRREARQSVYDETLA